MFGMATTPVVFKKTLPATSAGKVPTIDCYSEN